MDDAKYNEIIGSPGFCAYPFVQVSTVPAGFMRPCCFFTDILKNDDGSSANVDKNNFQTIWNNKNFKSIRNDMLSSTKVNGCLQCHKEDSFGGDSMRKRSLREWTWRQDFKEMVKHALNNDGTLESGIKFLELKPGNLCNLKCRMCNQFDSSKYASELQEIGAKFNKTASQARLFENYTFEYDFDLGKMADWTNNKQIWESFQNLAPQIEILSFAGGEPTLIEDVYKSLKYCVEKDLAKNITVYFASNFTQKMSKFIDLAQHFKRFDFIASIDGTEQTQEYIRFPSKWSVVESNFRDVNRGAAHYKNVNLMINLTLNIYNVLNFIDLLHWLEDDAFRPGLKEDPFNLNILMFPNYLSLELLPNNLRPAAIEKINNYLQTSWICKEKPHIHARLVQLVEMLGKNESVTENNFKLLKEFWIYTKILDQSRKQKLKDTLPSLYIEVEKLLTDNNFNFAESYEKYQITEQI
ncbi:MAG: twitch domain-containing radical SAM protein [Bdellovibrio sp.]|nr:twitch domain-containing radical SAM protein [Bdellovibrio sp.]